LAHDDVIAALTKQVARLVEELRELNRLLEEREKEQSK
jgi:hypothetical protein